MYPDCDGAERSGEGEGEEEGEVEGPLFLVCRWLRLRVAIRVYLSSASIPLRQEVEDAARTVVLGRS